MAGVLATPDDVADMWRPLADSEMDRVARLIAKASALLRQRLPWVDERIARFGQAPPDPGALDPAAVATVVATMVKRYLVNPDGATNISESQGPYSVSRGYALRGDKDVRGELTVTESDVAALTAPTPLSNRFITLGVAPTPSMACPVPSVAVDAAGDGYVGGVRGAEWIVPPVGG